MVVILLLAGLFVLIPSVAQNRASMEENRASMEAPVVRGTEEGVTIAVRFTGFAAGDSYRIGLGAAAPISSATLELKVAGQPLQAQTVEFSQGYTKTWWGMEELKVSGFVMKGDQLPSGGDLLGLKVTIPRADADKAGKVYVFVAKKYGENIWYLEDGVELSSSDW
jgi:hypothetical protein